jgi:hypothetical protein
MDITDQLALTATGNSLTFQNVSKRCGAVISSG